MSSLLKHASLPFCIPSISPFGFLGVDDRTNQSCRLASLRNSANVRFCDVSIVSCRVYVVCRNPDNAYHFALPDGRSHLSFQNWNCIFFYSRMQQWAPRFKNASRPTETGVLIAFITGNPLFGDIFLEISIGRGLEALKGLTPNRSYL